MDTTTLLIIVLIFLLLAAAAGTAADAGTKRFIAICIGACLLVDNSSMIGT